MHVCSVLPPQACLCDTLTSTLTHHYTSTHPPYREAVLLYGAVGAVNLAVKDAGKNAG